MAAHDLEKRVLQAYEGGRLRFGAMWGAGILALTLPVLGVSHQRGVVTGLILALAILLGWAAYRGRVAYAGARHGLLGGLIPLGLALLMRNLGQCYSVGGYCLSWCVAGCAIGGGAASLVIMHLAGHRRTSGAYWGAASLTVLLTGSLACGCAGMMGVAALGFGFVLGMLPAGRLVIAPTS